MDDNTQKIDQVNDMLLDEFQENDSGKESMQSEKATPETIIHPDDVALNNTSCKRRGEYGFYPQNLRVQIAKMALEKGVSKTADYFSDDLGRYVSPSTVASIRNQYLKEVSQCIEDNVTQISELPKADTGRPLILEELDSHISQCVQKIKESGGAINAAVIKRIARDIIITNNKSLLLEFGGPFELSNAWAEKTLKRIVNIGGKSPKNNQRTNTEKDSARNSSPGLEEMKQAYVDIITSAVATHGLSKELIPVVNDAQPKRRRSQREHVRSGSAVDGEATSKLESQSKRNEGRQNKNSGKQSGLKFKGSNSSAGRVKNAVRKRFRILQVPPKSVQRTVNHHAGHSSNSGKQINTEKSIVDASNVEIPENELIELAIPCMAGKRKRGDYATYTSEQRISMAKMALDIGVAKTAQHFTSNLGRFVSPSSVASMRNQYRKEVEKNKNDVMELPKGKRGRPLLLGHLDSEIKKAIEAIKDDGGKIGRNIVKSVARDIILSNNQGLLKEYGGPLQLTNTWAESVMKRMGFVRRRRNKLINSKTVATKKMGKQFKGVVNEFEELNHSYMDVIGNGINTGIPNHGIANDLDANYDQYSSHQISNPMGSHNYNSQVNQHMHANTPTNMYNMDMPGMNRNHQPSVPHHEQEAIMGLNHLRSQVENFSAPTFNQGNSYYGGWGTATSHPRDFPMMMGSFNQPGTGSYNAQVDLSSMHHQQQNLDRQSLANVARDNVNATHMSSGNYANQDIQLQSQFLQSNMSRLPVNSISARDPMSPNMGIALQESSPAPLSPSLLQPSLAMSQIVNNPTNENNISEKNSQSISATMPSTSVTTDCSIADDVFPEKSTSIITSTTDETNASNPEAKMEVLKDNKKSTKAKNAKDEKRKRGEYGVYTSEQRMKMAKLALEYGVTKAANVISLEVGRLVSSSTVASMRNLYLRELEKNNEEISELPKGKRGRPLLLGDLDSQIRRCLMNIRINGGVITRMVVVSVARGILLAKNKSLLKEYGGPVELSTTWAESVIRRMGFVRQKVDGLETVLPPDFENLKSAFLKRITSTVINHSIPKELILNFGQIALKIVPASSWTTESHNNDQQFLNLEIEDRREITSVLTVTLAGDLLPLQLVYTGKTDQCHPNIPFSEGWNITHTENHLCTNETMMQFADKLLVPYVVQTRMLLGLAPMYKALVVFDVLNLNQDKEFFARLRENNIEVVLIPTPCTSLLQPLELTVFKRFRDELQKLFVNWYSNEVCEAVRAGQNPSSVIVDLRLSVLKHLHAQWILKTHELLSRDRTLILEGFSMAGIIDALSTATATCNIVGS